MTRCRTFSFRLSPTVRHVRAFEDLLRAQCELYNAALEERRGAWKWEKRSVSYVDQCRTLTQLRAVRPEVLDHGVTVCRGTLKRLDRSFSAFYRRCRAGQTPGFPRFKSVHRWDSVQWEDTSSWKVDPDVSRLKLQGVGNIKLHLHRPIRGIPKAITLRRHGRRWQVSIRGVDVPANVLPETHRAVEIDLGVGVLVATSDGELIENRRHGKKAAAQLAEAQQALAAKRRGSRRRRKAVEAVARCHRKVANQRTDTLHKVSRMLVNENDLIVHEKLMTANMVRRPKPRPGELGSFEPNGANAKSGLNRSIYDAGWGILLHMIAYKAEEAGRCVIEFDPRNTSRRCSNCTYVAASNRRGANFTCGRCGHRDHADVNAAINILEASRALRLSAV